ncbi:LytTR family DNA-binding domain-containing protein [Alishewanella tabrizica]|uniref:HTH LytTR-type domain-containing protein n=1 Tax=Alishewanella tabrizica TaxID=671278 RepID=A0ABQ2WPQ3_9ALTE|nr:LytTR family DNA-binding domain-containing protein [Alishewanella tabrizica]GGW66262.1 hypothetical protein GCM10008111_22770 [Alishewanella tabrizica]
MNEQTFDFGDVSPIRYFLSIALILALLFALIDNSHNLPFWLQLLLWLYQSFIPMAFMLLSHKSLAHFDFFQSLNPWLKLLLSGLVGALCFVPLALAIDLLLALEDMPRNLISWTTAISHEISGVVPPVVMCWLAINAPWVMGFKMIIPNSKLPVVNSSQPITSETNIALIHNTPDPLQALLPANKQGELLYLKSELHYLLVVTEVGQTLILANLKDAISLCTHQEGIQPHRSYWVNKKAIKALRKTGREGCLLLHNADEIPVSRNKLNLVKAFLQQS